MICIRRHAIVEMYVMGDQMQAIETKLSPPTA